jgi:BirA family biotin operon repressor/biotin-[acetyl-CoA-carboxylase] ligase
MPDVPIAAGTVEVGRRRPRSQLTPSDRRGHEFDCPRRRIGLARAGHRVAGVDAPTEAASVTARWNLPNGVLVRDEELAGILAEVAAPKPAIVVAVGLNTTTTTAETPDPAATSLVVLGESVTRSEHASWTTQFGN